MDTITARSPELPKLIVKWQEELDPATGEFPSTQQIADRLAAEPYNIVMTRQGVGKAARTYRTRNGLPPAPKNQNYLPWSLPDDIHQGDINAYCLMRIARRERARQNGGQCVFHGAEARNVAFFERLLSRLGPHTVVCWDSEANQGKGGWLLRQAREGEEVWYGVMAVRP